MMKAVSRHVMAKDGNFSRACKYLNVYMSIDMHLMHYAPKIQSHINCDLAPTSTVEYNSIT